MPIILIVFISIIGTLVFFGLIISIYLYFSELSSKNELRDTEIHCLQIKLSLLSSRLNILENKFSTYNRFFVVTKKNKIIKTQFIKK